MQQGSTGGEDLRRQAESTTSTVMEQAKQTAEVQLSSQKDQAASTLHTLAESIRDGGQRMRDEQPQIASLADQAASRIDQASDYIRQHEVRDFVREAENFARREPLIFLGGAFALGFLAARFLKASSPKGNGRQAMSARQRDWYAVGPGYAGSGYGAGGGYGAAGSYAGQTGYAAGAGAGYGAGTPGAETAHDVDTGYGTDSVTARQSDEVDTFAGGQRAGQTTRGETTPRSSSVR